MHLPLFAVLRLLFKPLIITGVAQYHASDKFLNAPNIILNNIDLYYVWQGSQ